MSSTQTISNYSGGCFEDKFLHSPDVCSNCFSLIMIERMDPVRWSQERELDSTYERVKPETEIGFHSTHSVEPTDCKEVYCSCGMSDPYDRLWSAADIDRDRFEQLLKNVVRTARRKGISHKRKTTLGYALQRYDDTGQVDTALALGLDAGQHAEIAANE
jgi:hypothetical protein